MKVKAEANTSGGTRRAEFSVCSGDQSLQFHVIQDHFEMIFEVPETEMHVSASGGILPIPINTNQSFKVVCGQEWIVPSPSKGKRPEYVVVAVEPNLTVASRTSEIVISCDIADVTVTVTQDAAEGALAQWTEKSFASRSLAMRFTATWCGYCPMMGKAFDTAKGQMNGALELVSLHGVNQITSSQAQISWREDSISADIRPESLIQGLLSRIMNQQQQLHPLQYRLPRRPRSHTLRYRELLLTAIFPVRNSLSLFRYISIRQMHTV